jgi:ribosomal protein L3 glutamine methyltransferase
MRDHPADTLLTIRDFWRHATSAFAAAGLAHGHGATTARDEAAFIILESLKLPVDDLTPWLDARLMRDERLKLVDLIEKRIATRQPAAYLLGRTYIQGVPFLCDRRAIVPRSFIGELLFDEALVGDGGLIPDPSAVSTVLDLCCGGGSLAILAAMRFPYAAVDAVDLSGDALALARENIALHGLGERVRPLPGDLFKPLKGKRYDLVLANPPYVAEEIVDAFPPEFAAEPRMAHDGGQDGFDIVRRIIDGAAKHLAEGGCLVCEIGEDRHIREEAYPDTPFFWLDTQESEGEVFFIARDDLPGQ